MSGVLSLGAAAFAAVLLPARSPRSPTRTVDGEGRRARRAPLARARARRTPPSPGPSSRAKSCRCPASASPRCSASQVGVQVTETGGLGAPATASVRGATAAQLPVYLAGVCLNDDVAGTADLSRIPLWLVDRVEIYRGNAPARGRSTRASAARSSSSPAGLTAREAGAGQMLGSFGSQSTWGYASVGKRDAAVLAGVSAEIGDQRLSVRQRPRHAARAHRLVGPVDDQRAGRDLRRVAARARARWVRAARSTRSPTRRRASRVCRRWRSCRRARHARRSTAVSAERGQPSRSTPTGSRRSRPARRSRSARAVYSDPLDELALLAHRVTLAGARADERLALDVAATSSLTVRGALDVSSETLARDDDDAAALRAHRLESRAAFSARQWIGDSFSVQALGAAQCDGTSTTSTSACDLFSPTGRVGAAWTAPTWERLRERGPLRAHADARGALRDVGARSRQPVARAGVRHLRRRRPPPCGASGRRGRRSMGVPRRLRPLDERSRVLRSLGAGVRRAGQRRERAGGGDRGAGRRRASCGGSRPTSARRCSIPRDTTAGPPRRQRRPAVPVAARDRPAPFRRVAQPRHPAVRPRARRAALGLPGEPLRRRGGPRGHPRPELPRRGAPRADRRRPLHGAPARHPTCSTHRVSTSSGSPCRGARPSRRWRRTW